MKYPKRIKEIIDNQGKFIIQANKDIEKSKEEIYKESKEAENQLRRDLGI